MKTALSPAKTLLLGVGALVASAGIAAAQVAYTTPVGYHTETIESGFNVIGINLVDAPLVSSALTGAAATVLTDSEVTFTDVLNADSIYTIEFANGTWAEIDSFAANSVTTADDISAEIGGTDSYVIRKVRNLADFFGTDNSAGFLAGDSNTADIIWIPTAEGFAKAYYGEEDPVFGTTAGWKLVGEGDASQDGYPIGFTQGLIVQRQAEQEALELTFTGHVKLTPTVIVADSPFTYISRVYPTGSTLGNSGFVDSFLPGDSNTATLVWLPLGVSGFDKGFYGEADPVFGTTEGWKLVGAGDGDQANAELTSGMIIQRNQDAFTITMTPPDFYSEL